MSISKLELLDADLSNSTAPSSPTSPTQTISKLDSRVSVRPYRTSDEYLYAMKEDLAAWFNDLYSTNLTAENLIERLQDGIFLCHHANNVKSYIESLESHGSIPTVPYRNGIKLGSFQARDNVANFILWVKTYLKVNDVLLFESDDLVINKNEKNVILCLLEVARRGARYGMIAPMLIQFEQEIDALEQKIRRAEDRRNSQGSMNLDQHISSDTESDKASLDEWVQTVVRKCTCPKQFPLIHVSRGKYRIGYTQNVVFVRILRNHVMIRVGGGWDTLEHYLDKHDPCRCLKPHSVPDSHGRRRSQTSQERNFDSEKPPGDLLRSKSTSLSNMAEPRPVSQAKHIKQKSADQSGLVITKDGSGHHLIEEVAPSDNNVTNHSQNHTPSKRRSSSSKNSSPDKDHDATLTQSPSKTLINKLKDEVKTKSSASEIIRTRLKRSNTPTHVRSKSRQYTKTCKSLPTSRETSPYPTKDHQVSMYRNGSSTIFRNKKAAQKNLTRVRTKSTSETFSPINGFTRTHRSKSLSRPSTPEICTQNDASAIHASPRRYLRPSKNTIPTRIPFPDFYTLHINNGHLNNNNDIIDDYKSDKKSCLNGSISF